MIYLYKRETNPTLVSSLHSTIERFVYPAGYPETDYIISNIKFINPVYEKGELKEKEIEVIPKTAEELEIERFSGVRNIATANVKKLAEAIDQFRNETDSVKAGIMTVEECKYTNNDYSNFLTFRRAWTVSENDVNNTSDNVRKNIGVFTLDNGNVFTWN